MAPPHLGEPFPNLDCDTTIGKIRLYDYFESSWGILFSHPADFTPVCTTELARVVQLMPDFELRNVKVIAMSCDTVESHIMWSKDILSYAGSTLDTLPYPIIADHSRKIAKSLGMLDKDEVDQRGIPLTARSVFVIGPEKKLRLSILYPATTGRNFDEILRAIDSMQLTDLAKVATPADWKAGEALMVTPAATDDDFRMMEKVETIAMPSGKSYMKMGLMNTPPEETPAPEPQPQAS